MRRISIITASLASLLLACFIACSGEEVPYKPVKSRTPIGWAVYAADSKATRGCATTAANALEKITRFAVWAYDDTTDGLYIGMSSSEGRVVANTGDAESPAWGYAPQQYWPVNPLNIVAVTPGDDPEILSISTVSANNAVTLLAEISMDADVEDQKDIMVAGADGITSNSFNGNVPLTFQHALSMITFRGKLPESGTVTKVTIKEITLGNIGRTGVITFTSEGVFCGGNTYVTPTIYDRFVLVPNDLQGSVWEAGVNATAGTAFDLTVSNNSSKRNAWLMLPQRTAAWVPASDAQKRAGGMESAPTEGAYIKIRASLEKDGVAILGSTAADAIYIPLDANWDRSTHYVYTIEFNGSAALTPITFSVSAQDWMDYDKSIDVSGDDGMTIPDWTE